MSPLAPNPWGDRRRVRVGLLGGSFNPAHDGHRHIAESGLRLLGLDEVWLMVSPQNPLKSVADMAPLAERLESARTIAAAGNRRIRATSIETALGTRFTVDTMAALGRRFRRSRFVWLMGADNLVQLDRWARWPRLFQSVPVAVFARGAYSARTLASKSAHRFRRFRAASALARGLASKQPPAWVFLHIRRHPASSTAIRARLA
ncbi:nicotinic acid mononucleotide adenylyltransferase [Paramagnetospirillum marisnigri]|uniref:Probable nicotinate-nucleotide adenylyltransferase n=1 Tax=Paramagnetospirillum marisnigri TaxID=1285242 RepID=A0A178MMP1_9PROT|nr:nicotinate-nucleotide adenylyltransferase [Paramagnetospirillum marisnigri]OAN49204.1 nicotinic acid mononucleotide adenylyltransferase [Paramagnetospirillum marisnigri]